MARYGTEKEADTLRYFSSCAKYGIVEIGVLDGETTKILLEASCVPVYGIDPLIPDSMNPGLIGHEEQIKNNCKEFGYRFIFYKDYSYNVINTFKHKIDVVFIDGDHSYNSVKRDYECWKQILECSGVLLFHDSAPVINFNGHEGPLKLVSELMKNDCVEYIGTWDTITGFRKNY